MMSVRKMRVIAGLYKGQLLRSLKGNQTRPTTGKIREAVFSSLQGVIVNTTWLDLFAGSGGMGIEALSRGAKFCYFVDSNPRACKVIEENLIKLGIDGSRANLLCCSAERACKLIRGQGRLDIAYLDPPYYNPEAYVQAITSVQPLLVPEGLLILEHSSGFIPEAPYADLIRTKSYGRSAVSFFKKRRG